MTKCQQCLRAGGITGNFSCLLLCSFYFFIKDVLLLIIKINYLEKKEQGKNCQMCRREWFEKYFF